MDLRSPNPFDPRKKIKGPTQVNGIIKSGLIYTCQCGWIDLGHAYPHSTRPHEGAAQLWAAVYGETGERTPDGAWHRVSIRSTMGTRKFGPDLTWGPLFSFAVRTGLSIQDKEEVALAIFMTYTWHFERLQLELSMSDTLTDSGFSADDLVSNLIGFYRAVREPHELFDLIALKDRGLFNFLALVSRCQPVSKAAAEKVWDTYGPPGTRPWKVFGFNRPRLFPCSECPGGVTRPGFGSPLPELNAIKPAEYGVNYLFWNEVLRNPPPGPNPGLDVPVTLGQAVIGQPCRSLPGQNYDSLSRVAQDFYGDALLWPVLWDHPDNRRVVGANPNLVTRGQTIIIPDIRHLTPADREGIWARGRDWRQYR